MKVPLCLALMNLTASAAVPTTYRYFEVAETQVGITHLTVIPDASPPRWAREVSAKAHAWPPPAEAPFFAGPTPLRVLQGGES